jgi:hypothetical protein
MTRVFFLIAITATAVVAAESSDAHKAWFRDGAALEIFAETTGGVVPSSAAQGILGMNYGRMVRAVVDANNSALFGYMVEAYRDTKPGTIAIRVRPLDPKAMELLSLPGLGIRIAGTGIPTVSAVREFHFVRAGEVVALDISNNPSTGGKVYDVIRPIDEPSPHPGLDSEGPVPSREELSLKDIALRVNGQDVSAPRSWMVGAAARINVPGHGSYVVAAYDPQRSGRPFLPNVVSSGKSLTWSMDGDDIEITSQTNVLTGALQGSLWVYHDPNFQERNQPDAVEFQTGDSVESLLAKK